jgi:outer membrane immunogenic protein
VSATETTATTPAFGGASLTIDGFSGRGALGGAHAGCDYQIQRIVLGGFADYTFQDVEWSAALTAPGFGFSGNAKLAIEDQWTVGGRLGVLLNDSTLAYGLVGYTQAKASDLELTSTLGNLSFAVEDLKGWTVGAGIETRLMANLFLGAEYRYTKFDNEDVTLIPGALNLGLDPEVHSVRAALRYKFGSPVPLADNLK